MEFLKFLNNPTLIAGNGPTKMGENSGIHKEVASNTNLPLVFYSHEKASQWGKMFSYVLS